MDDHTEAELKRCPFCGGKAFVEYGDCGGRCIACESCGASMHNEEAWNQRATLASAPATRDNPSPVDATASLIDAARAVVGRWHTPVWKEVEHTAAFIARLDEAATRAAGEAPPAQQWVPIADAPASCEVLVYMPEEKTQFQVMRKRPNVTIIGNVFAFDLTKPTHYMPLPAAPQHQGGGK